MEKHAEQEKMGGEIKRKWGGEGEIKCSAEKGNGMAFKRKSLL